MHRTNAAHLALHEIEQELRAEEARGHQLATRAKTAAGVASLAAAIGLNVTAHEGLVLLAWVVAMVAVGLDAVGRNAEHRAHLDAIAGRWTIAHGFYLAARAAEAA